MKLLGISLVILIMLLSGCNNTSEITSDNGGSNMNNKHNEQEIKNDEKNTYLIGFKDEINTEVITSVGGEVKEILETGKIIVSELTEKQMEEIQKHPDVKYVELDGEAKALKKSK